MSESSYSPDHKGLPGNMRVSQAKELVAGSVRKGDGQSGATMSENGNLIIYPIPSLVATLLNRERAKGTPLTEDEVIQIRDSCPAIALTQEDARRVDESRGYLDIDPENCWEEWQRVRLELAED
ncbi:hypothetical protein [Mesorhizobium sp. B2-1-3A]|uniref:hypothetical protein n=1 Tax=Mesorhizobium sp. B2-1-3A TaxID=2589971 RepID=UPI001AEDEA08|nr:hypothetical protein [Mesorhizobium sp. B2-1-3A]